MIARICQLKLSFVRSCNTSTRGSSAIRSQDTQPNYHQSNSRSNCKSDNNTQLKSPHLPQLRQYTETNNNIILPNDTIHKSSRNKQFQHAHKHPPQHNHQQQIIGNKNFSIDALEHKRNSLDQRVSFSLLNSSNEDLIFNTRIQGEAAGVLAQITSPWLIKHTHILDKLCTFMDHIVHALIG